MAVRKIGILMHGVTGRMGTNQHLIRSICAIRDSGGVVLASGHRLLPEPILIGRNADKVEALARAHGVTEWTTNLDEALARSDAPVFFDAASTSMRPALLKRAIAAGKHVYCEKPTAETVADALSLARTAEQAGVKNGAVQDKLWLPGLLKLRQLIESGALGRILSARIDFGYWVFDGEDVTAQRPSWNYRKADGGGIILDMMCHWRYVIDNLIGIPVALTCLGVNHVQQRWDESHKPYAADADDACYATVELDNGAVVHIASSWATRVRRDDLVTFHVDGTLGSAVAGLTDCRFQSLATTPRAIWNPDQRQPLDLYADWQLVPEREPYGNAFRVQWELFLRHVAEDAPFRWTLREAAKGVQFAELALRSWHERRWLDVPALEA